MTSFTPYGARTKCMLHFHTNVASTVPMPSTGTPSQDVKSNEDVAWTLPAPIWAGAKIPAWLHTPGHTTGSNIRLVGMPMVHLPVSSNYMGKDIDMRIMSPIGVNMAGPNNHIVRNVGACNYSNYYCMISVKGTAVDAALTAVATSAALANAGFFPPSSRTNTARYGPTPVRKELEHF